MQGKIYDCGNGRNAGKECRGAGMLSPCWGTRIKYFSLFLAVNIKIAATL
jgi:hypothetical protein